MNNLHMGTYINRESPIHSLSAKIKTAAFVLTVVFTLIFNSPIMYLADFLIIILCTVFSKLKIKEVFGFLKRLWIFLLVILLMNMLFYSVENPDYTFGIINISKEGFYQGCRIALNVLLIITLSNILLASTSPIELMNAIRFYLTPLKLIKVPVDDLTLIISVAIQFIPALLDEATNIKKAQIARGAEFESKNPFKRAKSILPLIVPIFIGAFKRADELSMALEARGFRGSDINE